MTTVKEFLSHHGACSEGLNWAVENCKTMQEVWDNAKPEWLVWLATREGVLSAKDQRLFACWCARINWNLLDDAHKKCVEVAEKFALGEATKDEMASASAWASAWASARASARASVTASASARASARASVSASASAWASARASVTASASASASDADWEIQAQYLRTNYTPNFNPENT